jgi:hypothetical protein
MISTLSTLKSRLAIEPADPQYDSLLTAALQALGPRFDKETNRTLARTENFTQEFHPHDTEILAACYPIETVTKFETKTSESTGWQEITPAPDYLIRCDCVISLPSAIFNLPSSPAIFRVTYTGGYVMPDSNLQLSTFTFQLPADREQAAVEQIAFWFKNRDHTGLKTYWPTGVAYQQFATQDLLASVQSVLSKYRRWSIT